MKIPKLALFQWKYHKLRYFFRIYRLGDVSPPCPLPINTIEQSVTTIIGSFLKKIFYMMKSYTIYIYLPDDVAIPG